MEKYTLRELIDNKEAQATLLETGFYMNSTFFGGMSYPDLSLQEILMAVFENIEEYGEDEVLQRMFEAGGTCLTNDPKATKSGVKPAGNSKKYFVKSNMGKELKFTAILKAMMSFETHQMPEKLPFGSLFSADEMIFSTEPLEEEFTFEMDLGTAFGCAADGESAPFHEEDHFNPFAIAGENEPKNYSFVTRKDEHCIFDEDQNCFTSLTYRDEWNEPVTFEVVHAYEILKHTNEEGDTEEYGWKYQLEENGEWGWISNDFKYVLRPQFKNFVFAGGVSHPYMLAIKPYGMWIYLSEEGTLINLHLLHEGIHENAIFDIDFMYKEFHEEGNVYEALISSKGEYSENLYYVEFSKNDVLSCRAYDLKDGLLKTENKSAIMGAFDLDAYHALKWYDTINLFGTLEDKPVYAVEKDFYWALFMGDEQLTPYAFTSIEAICSDREFEPYEKIDKKPYLNLQQFGRYGLYNLKKKEYALPCEYDRPFNTRYGSEWYFWLHKNGKVGLYSPKADKIVLSCEYDMIYTETTHQFDPVKNGKVGLFVTETNKLVIPCDFEYIEFSGYETPSLYTLVQQNGKFGLYHTKGDNINPYLLAIPCDYDKIERLWDKEYEGKYVYEVQKGPFTGIYNVTNRTWIEHLHKA